ncbi:MAG TPA: hypothetical protein VE081_00630 [Sporichthyaceae bacterium]|nr:hypothetical protein [Sporichthyaceae bacterium]
MRTSVTSTTIALIVLTASGVSAVGAPRAAAAGDAASRAAKITSALSAAPRSVSAHATVKDYPSSPKAQAPVLRAGGSAWTCFPDDPTTPGPDPICLDRQSLAWVDAWLAHKPPHLSSDGYSYMLRGSSDASDTDPFATKPPKGERWMTAPPHVMVFPAHPAALNRYSGDRGKGGPWVMFRGTPYAHLMFPVGSADTMR